MQQQIATMNINYQNKLIQLFKTYNISHDIAIYLSAGIYLLAALLLCYLLLLISKKIIALLQRKFMQNKAAELSGTQRKVPGKIGTLMALLVFAGCMPIVFYKLPFAKSVAEKTLDILLIVSVATVLRAMLRLAKERLENLPSLREKPLESYLQVVNIFLYFVAGLAIFSRLTGISALAFLTAMGAASAILLIVFKDSIMGFVASIQVSVNDMVRIGDWIEMSKYGADGDVTEITINTVKVQNWDKTITTIPTYALISDSFKNYRGMQRSGGRRIKRAVNIKIASIKFVNETELEQLSNVTLLKNFINDRNREIKTFNETKKADTRLPLNGRNMTNVGLFRRYVQYYLDNTTTLNQDMICMVRQLAPTPHGLPIEIYAFTQDVRWVYYEQAMADIFDHLLAAVPYFGLVTHEAPASDDIKTIGANLLPTREHAKN